MQTISMNVESIFSKLNDHQRRHLEALARLEKVSLEQYLFQIINNHLEEIERDIPPLPQENAIYH